VFNKNINHFYQQLSDSELKDIKKIGRIDNEIFY